MKILYSDPTGELTFTYLTFASYSSSCPLLSEHEDDDLNGYDAQEHGEWVNIGVAH